MDRASEIVVFSFTEKGTRLNSRICEIYNSGEICCRGYAPLRYASGDISPLPDDMKKWISARWGRCAFIFVGAAGIAVRYIAECVKDKFSDSPVIVTDEKGRYVIPLLSGHAGGAAGLADDLAEKIGAVPVHTTATDVEGKFAPDVFAVRNNLKITDRKKAKEISAAVLRGEETALFVDSENFRLSGEIPDGLHFCKSREEADKYPFRVIVTAKEAKKTAENELILKPVNIVAGIGCRKGISQELLEEGLKDILGSREMGMECIKAFASIEIKREEEAILGLSEKYGVPFAVFSAEELSQIKSVSTGSDFVMRVTGVDNVCERAALFCCPEGRLIAGKQIREGMTAALVEEPLTLHFGKRGER